MIPKAALDQHIAILGKTGSGKTYAAKGVVEGLLDDHRQICVLDPTGAWWGLRLGADGKARGYDIVLLGGAHADIPLAERSGAAVARLVTEQRASVVIDTSGFTVGEYTRWFIDFAGTLYTTIRSPLHLVIDEAHYFMPQGKSPDVDAGKMLHAGNRLMSGGRSKGIRGMLVTQRPAKLHKDSLTCADTMIAMRVIAPQDRGAIKEWVDGSGNAEDGRRVLDSLAGLGRGEGWIWYPEGGHLQRVTFPRIRTYDSSRTPEHGAKAGPKVSEIKLDEVRAAMSEAVREAEAHDPKVLRARIAELEAAARKAPKAAAPDTSSIEAKARAAGRAEAVKHLERVGSMVSGLSVHASQLADELKAIMDRCDAAAEELEAPAVLLSPKRLPPVLKPSPSLMHANGLTPKPDSGLGGRGQRLLDAAATLEVLGVRPNRVTVCGWIGVHPRGGSIGEELKNLEAAGLICVDRGEITVTDSGRAAVGSIDTTGAIERARSGLTGRQARIFDLVVAAYPSSTTREEVAAGMGIHPRGGSFAEDIARLAGRGLIESSRGVLRARDFLFAEGQR